MLAFTAKINKFVYNGLFKVGGFYLDNFVFLNLIIFKCVVKLFILC